MRLLLIEDDDDITTVIEQTLRKEGFSVDRAANGIDGLWLAEEGTYGLIVLDLLLPEMSGYKVCESIRAKGIATPVLMLTAKVGDYDETDGFDAGADDYLRKPFAPDVLAARSKALVRRGSPASRVRNVLERGAVRLDPATRTCTLAGAEVDLTRRQAQVLEALLRTGEAPIARLDLVRAVWGIDFNGDPNVADVYIGYLRAKLGKEVVENVRGLGFRVKA